MRTCVYCEKPLPASTRKGGRRREFCNDVCKNRHYREYKQIKHDAGMLAEPYWRHAYRVLRGQYEMLEFRLQGYLKDDEERVSYLDARERSIKHLYKRCQEMRVDYVARLKALGVSENDIKEFDVYWKEQMDESLLS